MPKLCQLTECRLGQHAEACKLTKWRLGQNCMQDGSAYRCMQTYWMQAGKELHAKGWRPSLHADFLRLELHLRFLNCMWTSSHGSCVSASLYLWLLCFILELVLIWNWGGGVGKIFYVQIEMPGCIKHDWYDRPMGKECVKMWKLTK